MAKGTLRIRTTAFVCPQRTTCFVRCVSCIDGLFANAVLKVYKDLSMVPRKVDVSDADAGAARASLERSVTALTVHDSTARISPR